MRRAFLSYRRDDAPTVTSFLYEQLEDPAAFGPNSVFMDIDGIPPGVDFRDVIEEAVTQCEFFLAVIGKHWASAKDELGQPRLMNPNDFVRMEIEAALRRNIPVTPVLVDGAAMPRPEQLPESLHPLLYKNAKTIGRGKAFPADVASLVAGMHKAAEWYRRKGVPFVAPPAPGPTIDAAAANELARQQIARREGAAAGATFEAFPPALRDPRAMNLLGMLYDRGDGVPQDYSEAMRWFRRAAELGDPTAMCNIGSLYMNGQGILQDYAEALVWFRKAADLGFALAMCNIGSLHRHGRGLPQSHDEALVWFLKAAALGEANSMNNIGMLYDQGHGVAQDYAEAMRWFRKAANGGCATAMSNIGMLYKNGQSVPKDARLAGEWFEKAIAAGYEPAQDYLKNL